jgi:hypothetical protein
MLSVPQLVIATACYLEKIGYQVGFLQAWRFQAILFFYSNSLFCHNAVRHFITTTLLTVIKKERE